MNVDLVQTTTRDGVRLDGMYQAPATPSSLPVGAFCCVHGTGGNFYSSTLFDEIAARLLELGCGVLRVNTRGHDGISNAATSAGGRRIGAAYEVLDECRHDLAAWVEWLTARAGQPVGLLGHSSGAVKAIYALAHEPNPGVGCLVALSPPRLSYAAFCSGSLGEQFLRLIEEAERLVESGQPAALMESSVPLPMAITAAGFLEKYGPHERYNFLNFIAGISCPALCTFGSVEVENNVAFQGTPEALAELRRKRPQLHVATIAGADHFYTGVRPELIACVEGWLTAGGT
jgi:pimeloyl-ACP methyl ester carboxylesterase